MTLKTPQARWNVKPRFLLVDTILKRQVADVVRVLWEPPRQPLSSEQSSQCAVPVRSDCILQTASPDQIIALAEGHLVVEPRAIWKPQAAQWVLRCGFSQPLRWEASIAAVRFEGQPRSRGLITVTTYGSKRWHAVYPWTLKRESSPQSSSIYLSGGHLAATRWTMANIERRMDCSTSSPYSLQPALPSLYRYGHYRQ